MNLKLVLLLLLAKAALTTPYDFSYLKTLDNILSEDCPVILNPIGALLWHAFAADKYYLNDVYIKNLTSFNKQDKVYKYFFRQNGGINNIDIQSSPPEITYHLSKKAIGFIIGFIYSHKGSLNKNDTAKKLSEDILEKYIYQSKIIAELEKYHQKRNYLEKLKQRKQKLSQMIVAEEIDQEIDRLSFLKEKLNYENSSNIDRKITALRESKHTAPLQKKHHKRIKMITKKIERLDNYFKDNREYFRALLELKNYEETVKNLAFEIINKARENKDERENLIRMMQVFNWRRINETKDMIKYYQGLFAAFKKYNNENLKFFHHYNKNNHIIHYNNEDIFLNSLIKKLHIENDFPFIPLGYVTRGKYFFPDCGESAFRNLLNIILFDTEKNTYAYENLFLLFETNGDKEKQEEIAQFYFSLSKMRENELTRETRFKWARILSTIPNVPYRHSDNIEIAAIHSNNSSPKTAFDTIVSYIFGVPTTEDLLVKASNIDNFSYLKMDENSLLSIFEDEKDTISFTVRNKERQLIFESSHFGFQNTHKANSKQYNENIKNYFSTHSINRFIKLKEYVSRQIF